MKHDCISQVRKDLKKQDPEATYIRFELCTIRGEQEDIMTGQAITVGYNHTKRNGDVIDKPEKTFVTHDYCPFCGKKYQ